jgi:hypothetical protein
MSQTTVPEVETPEVEAKTRDTFMKRISKERAIVEANCFPYDPAKDRKRLTAMEVDADVIEQIIAGKVAKIEERKAGFDRVQVGSDLLCALEFFVIEQEEKRLANLTKVSAAAK